MGGVGLGYCYGIVTLGLLFSHNRPAVFPGTEKTKSLMELFGETLPVATGLFLLLALLMALSFEFVNGFHDTANAVATVIYTHSLRPWIAVIWSGVWNLIGVLDIKRGGRILGGCAAAR